MFLTSCTVSQILTFKKDTAYIYLDRHVCLTRSRSRLEGCLTPEAPAAAAAAAADPAFEAAAATHTQTFCKLLPL